MYLYRHGLQMCSIAGHRPHIIGHRLLGVISLVGWRKRQVLNDNGPMAKMKTDANEQARHLPSAFVRIRRRYEPGLFFALGW